MDKLVDEEAVARAHEACENKQLRSEPREGFCNVTWDKMLCWESVPSGSIATQSCPEYVYQMNKHGVAVRECGPTGQWVSNIERNNTDGWTDYTDCFRSHSPEIESFQPVLAKIQLMSNIGYGFSLVSLIVAILIMLLSRRLHCKSNSLHMNLFLAFILRASVSFLKDILFVEGLGLEKDVIRLEDGKVDFIEEGPHWECKLLVTVFVYAVSASLMWIFMEGLYLHMLVYKTLFTDRTGIRMYVVIGWVSPLLYTIPWILVRSTVDNTYCWNMDPFGYIWIIKGPIILTILINFIFFINIVRVLCIRMQTHRNTRGGNNQQLRKLAKFSLVLIPLFGVFYIVFAAYPHGISVHADMIYLYLEMFYNSFQGLVLAILFCFLNEEVHNEIRRCWYRRRRSENPFTRSLTLTSYRKGSCMSHTSATNGTRDCRKVLQIKNSKKDTNSNPVKGNRYQIDDKGRSELTQVSENYKYSTHDDTEQTFPLME